MPSAEETTYLIKVMPETTQEFLSQDVDLLVSQIKENLRISRLKVKTASCRKRSLPYKIPSRSWADPSSCEICGVRNSNVHDQSLSHHNHHNHHHHHSHHKRSTTSDEDDPYELLQELLREGGLIKEAVKRLQANLGDMENSEDDKTVREENTSPLGYRRKQYFYDSEDEPLTPVFDL
ncbi:GSK-3-binding protein-like [Prorops nasuta]|uniref:GSK-3-binding protein-like n=1 Tax=Prorops nasuta TaxID=863751 RepID=UPI0034CFD32B